MTVFDLDSGGCALSDDSGICCLHTSTLLELRVWFEGDGPDLMCLDIKETNVGPVCHQWKVCWFKSDTIRIPFGNPVVFKAVMTIENNGLYDPLFHCWVNLSIGGDEGMKITTLDGDAPGGYILPWLSGLPSCLCIVVIKGSCVYAIVWCLLRTVPSVRFGTLVAMMDVTAAENSMLPMTMLSHLGGGGGQSERSEWLPKVSQWVGA